MPLKTPAFWYDKGHPLSLLLTPLAWVYQSVHKLNQRRQTSPYQSTVPVICVGNAIAGGSGKTPTVMALVDLIQRDKLRLKIFILSRGYGGTILKATLVDPERHNASDVGDEALLLARHAPTIIAADRAEGAKLAEQHGADLVIMDDGLVNNDLKKNLTFLVIDRQIDFGNGKTIPAGPLREPLADIFPKINAVICIGRGFYFDKPVFESDIEILNVPKASKNYIAFCGIAHPQKFKRSLDLAGIKPLKFIDFPDHHHFSAKDIVRLKNESRENDALLITTEKDHVRLPPDFAAEVQTLNIGLRFHTAETLSSYIHDHLNKK